MTGLGNYKTRFYIIAVGLVTSIFIYLGLAFFLKDNLSQNSTPSDPQVVQMMFYILLGLSAVHIPLMLFFRNVIKNGKEKGNMTLQREMSLWIVHTALGTAPSIFGLTLFIISRDINYVYLFTGISLSLTALFFPRDNFLEENKENN